MSFRFARILTLAATIGSVALSGLFARPVAAQFAQDGTAYYVTGDHLLDMDVSGFEILVGKDNATDFDTLAGTITLDIIDGTVTTYSPGFGAVYPDDFFYTGLIVFGEHVANISGTATLSDAYTADTGTINVSGGLITDYLASADASTINISGGTIDARAGTFGASTMNISGGLFTGFLESHDASTITISGGTINAPVLVHDTSTLRVSGGIVESIEGKLGSLVEVSGTAELFQSAVFDASTLNISGSAAIFQVLGSDTSTVNISGDAVVDFVFGTSTGTVNISGGVIGKAIGIENSIFNISGGFISDVIADGGSVFNISGGTISASTIFNYSDTAIVKFFGTDLVFSNAADGFDGDGAPGVFYDVSWTRLDGSVLNTRYFDFEGSIGSATPQGAVFVVIPEAGTLTLVLPALGTLGIMLARRKRE